MHFKPNQGATLWKCIWIFIYKLWKTSITEQNKKTCSGWFCGILYLVNFIIRENVLLHNLSFCTLMLVLVCCRFRLSSESAEQNVGGSSTKIKGGLNLYLPCPFFFKSSCPLALEETFRPNIILVLRASGGRAEYRLLSETCLKLRLKLSLFLLRKGNGSCSLEISRSLLVNCNCHCQYAAAFRYPFLRVSSLAEVTGRLDGRPASWDGSPIWAFHHWRASVSLPAIGIHTQLHVHWK